jgi:four helix bundle protein
MREPGDRRDSILDMFFGMQNYRRLSVWRKAHAVTLNVHRLTERIPPRRHAGLVGQLQRAALSIPANIAEGASRATDKDFTKFLQVALASTTEVEYHLEFAADAEIIPRRDFILRHQEVIEIRRMLTGLVKYLRQADR